MSDHADGDLSPALGGSRAAEAPSEPTPEPEPGPAASELPPELETLFQELGGPDLARFFGQIGALSAGFQSLVEVVEERLPPTIAAFEGLIGAVEEALAPLLEDPPAPPLDEPR